MNVFMRMLRYACTLSARAAMLHVIPRASSTENKFYKEHILSLSGSRRASCDTRSRMAASLPLQTAKVRAGESMRGRGGGERTQRTRSAHVIITHFQWVYLVRRVCVCARAWTLRETERARARELESSRECVCGQRGSAHAEGKGMSLCA
jgi:hypothetical protein